MLLPLATVARDVDATDLSDLTSAKRTGSAAWVDGGLDVPFDRDLTPDEVDAVVLRLTTVDDAQEQLHRTAEDFLAIASPTATQQRNQLRTLTRLVMQLRETR